MEVIPQREEAAAGRVLRLKENIPGLHNVIQIGDRLLTGSEPHGTTGFESLQKLGVLTIISVDGIQPDLVNAKLHGMRYVHIPIGYEGVSDASAMALARAAQELKGPVYMHCHHGKHRGPAAAAIFCRAASVLTADEARAYLTLAGTGQEYVGLWRDVAAYQPSAEPVDSPELVESAAVPSLATNMAKLDRVWDHLKLCREAGWKSPSGHSELIPGEQAVLAFELLQESLRLTTSDGNYDEQFLKSMSEAAAEAERVNASLQAGQHDHTNEAMAKIEANCKACHKAYRN